MSNDIDYDADLAHRLDTRLAAYAPMERIASAPPRTNRLRVAGAAALAAVTLTAAGVGFEANAYADSQGLSCVDTMTKIQLFGASIADQFRGASLDEQRAAKQRVIEYAIPLMTESCGGAYERNSDGTYNWLPKPSPSGAAPQQAPAGTFDPSRTPKPSNPLPSPTGRP